MTARVAFKKRKVVHERVVWIVSVFDNPNDIRNYDGKTMTRLGARALRKECQVREEDHHSGDIRQEVYYHSTPYIEHKKQNQSANLDEEL